MTRLVVVITCVTAVVALIHGFRGPAPSASLLTSLTGTPASSQSTALPSSGDSVPMEDASTAAPGVPRLGIVAGHWGFDDGTVCPDGLTEVEVNRDVSELVVRSLAGLGYEVDLLQEFDPRLEGYYADALVSVHADSCDRFPEATPPPTGFKVASVVDSYVPEEERRLVECLRRAYAERTGLPFHENSITGHMTGYHTFYAIDGRTPGAIIETGFLWLDRDLLTQHPDVVAQGIVDGIICFLDGN